MLVLTRQRDQTVIIDGGIEVTVVRIRGDKVQLGFTAPRSITIHRKEVQDLIQGEGPIPDMCPHAEFTEAQGICVCVDCGTEGKRHGEAVFWKEANAAEPTSAVADQVETARA